MMMMIQTDSHLVSEPSAPLDSFVGFPPPAPPLPLPTSNLPHSSPVLLPHQEVNVVLNRENLTEIPARSVPSVLMSKENIWTRRVLPTLRIKQTLFDEHYSPTSPSSSNKRYRRASVSTSFLSGIHSNGAFHSGSISLHDETLLSFVLLDATSKMLYDVPMRHLIQLVKKDFDDDTSIDHVIRAIDQIQMKSEWLDAVIALNKQFDKRPEDKARVLAHQGSTDGLVLIEQFFVKLVRVPAYELKLIFLKFREEVPGQLERMTKHIHDLFEAIEVILSNEQLPGILHLLCLVYNSITGKQIPGIHFESLLSVLSTRTTKQNTTIAHLLCHLFEEQYPSLLTIFENPILLKLKDLSMIKYVPIYHDIRLFYARYQQLNRLLDQTREEKILLPEHFYSSLNEFELIFHRLFADEMKLKQGEKDLCRYFCLEDFALDLCFSTLGQCLDKLRLAQMQNVEQRRRNDLSQRQQRPNRSTSNQYTSETNIFRDHLNVPLTPISARQREKLQRTTRERHSISSRDISYSTDHDEQIIEKFFSNAITRKREHSPISKAIFTKRTLNTLNKLENEDLDEVFLSKENHQMDCANISTIVLRNLFDDASSDQTIPNPNYSKVVPTPTQTEENLRPNSTEFPSMTIDLSSDSSSTSSKSKKTNVSKSKTVSTATNKSSNLRLRASMKKSETIETLSSVDRDDSTRTTQNIQRCAVSRQICPGKDSDLPSNGKMATSIKNFRSAIKTTAFSRPSETTAKKSSPLVPSQLPPLAKCSTKKFSLLNNAQSISNLSSQRKKTNVAHR